MKGWGRRHAAMKTLESSRTFQRPSRSSRLVCITSRTCRQRRACQVATAQQSGLTEPATATRVRVERQTHLPASREEAWAALKQLVPREEWQEMSAVFVALENIYRCTHLLSRRITSSSVFCANFGPQCSRASINMPKMTTRDTSNPMHLLAFYLQ